MSARRGIAVFLGALWVSGAALSTRAQTETVERVVAIVNDQAVYLSELREQALPVIAHNVAQGGDRSDETLKKVYAQVLDNLVDDKLLRQLADKEMILVSKEDVDRAIQSVREQNGMSEEDLKRTLKQQGMSESEYRKSINQQLVRLKVLNQHVRSRVNITDDAVRREYENRVRQTGKSLRYRVSQIVVPVAQAGDAIEDSKARKQVEELHKKLDGKGEKVFQEEPGVDDLGWIDQNDIDANVGKELLTTGVGGISKPIRTHAGYAIYFVHQRETGSSIGSFDELREPILNELTDQAMEKQTVQFLKELRRGAQIRYSL